MCNVDASLGKDLKFKCHSFGWNIWYKTKSSLKSWHKKLKLILGSKKITEKWFEKMTNKRPGNWLSTQNNPMLIKEHDLFRAPIMHAVSMRYPI